MQQWSSAFVYREREASDKRQQAKTAVEKRKKTRAKLNTYNSTKGHIACNWDARKCKWTHGLPYFRSISSTTTRTPKANRRSNWIGCISKWHSSSPAETIGWRSEIRADVSIACKQAFTTNVKVTKTWQHNPFFFLQTEMPWLLHVGTCSSVMDSHMHTLHTHLNPCDEWRWFYEHINMCQFRNLTPASLNHNNFCPTCCIGRRIYERGA